jgi:hypothetical protein
MNGGSLLDVRFLDHRIQVVLASERRRLIRSLINMPLGDRTYGMTALVSCRPRRPRKNWMKIYQIEFIDLALQRTTQLRCPIKCRLSREGRENMDLEPFQELQLALDYFERCRRSW